MFPEITKCPFKHSDRDLMYSLLLAVQGGTDVGALTNVQLRATPVPVTIPNPSPVTLPSGAHVLTSVSGAATSTVAAGASSVVFLPASDFVGTIDGVSYPGTDWQAIPFHAQPGRTLPAIDIVVTSGTLNYYKLV